MRTSRFPPCSSKYMLPRPVPPGRGYPRQGRFPWPWKPFPCLKSRPLRRKRGPEEGRGLAGGFSFSALDMPGFGFGVPRQPADLTLLLFMRQAGTSRGRCFQNFQAVKTGGMEAPSRHNVLFFRFLFWPQSFSVTPWASSASPAANASQSQGGVLLYRTCPFKGWWKEDKINWRTLLQFSVFLP